MEKVIEKEKPVKLDPSFKHKVSSHPGGESVKACFSCGVCTAACPVNEAEEKFNPRQIIRLILIGDKEGILSSDMIWYCILCERCFANCPQNVNFAYIARALRELAVEEKYADKALPEIIQNADKEIHALRKGLLMEILKEKKKVGKVNIGQLIKKTVGK